MIPMIKRETEMTLCSNRVLVQSIGYVPGQVIAHLAEGTMPKERELLMQFQLLLNVVADIAQDEVEGDDERAIRSLDWRRIQELSELLGKWAYNFSSAPGFIDANAHTKEALEEVIAHLPSFVRVIREDGDMSEADHLCEREPFSIVDDRKSSGILEPEWGPKENDVVVSFLMRANESRSYYIDFGPSGGSPNLRFNLEGATMEAAYYANERSGVNAWLKVTNTSESLEETWRRLTLTTP